MEAKAEDSSSLDRLRLVISFLISFIWDGVVSERGKEKETFEESSRVKGEKKGTRLLGFAFVLRL